MVHVVSCHHFISQDVFLSKQEPTAFCCSEEKLFIATSQPAINVHDLDSRGNILHTFATVDQVEQLIFCDLGNYIGTLETKLLNGTTQETFVRIYFKWWIAMRDQSTKTRSPASPNMHLKNSANLPEMVELPLKERALAIACCKKTAAFVVSLGYTISVFCYNGQFKDLSKQTQHHFNHIMDIDLNFTVVELAIYECYLACRSENQVRVFKVVVESENNPSSASSDDANRNNSKILSDENMDEHFVEWRFESCLEDGSSDIQWENHLKEHLHPGSFPITVTFPSIEKANQLCEASENCEILGPLLTVKGHKIKVKLQTGAFELWSLLSYSNINVVTLVYREFSSAEKHTLVLLKLVTFNKSGNSKRASLDPLHAAAIEHEETQSSISGMPFQLADHLQSKAVGCFFSTAQEGYLYDVVQNIEMIGSYHYTAALKCAVIEPAFLHALTDAGLETYTSHLPHRTIQHFEHIDNVKNTCPDFKSPVCLLGLRPFLGVHRLALSENHLVLISSMDDSEPIADSSDAGSCTIYALRKPSPQQIFSDLLEVAQMCKTSSPTTYQLVLSEGHMILRIHLFLGKSCENEVSSLYFKSCILLADHWACSSNAAEKILAAPYYHLSQLPVDEVIQRLFGFQNKMKHVSVLKPLIQYLNPILLENTNVTLPTIPKSVAENILDAYMDESPDLLWKVILCSGISSYRVEKAMMMLKRRITSKRHLLSSSTIAADTLAIVSLLLKKNNIDAAQNMMLSLLKLDLVAILTEIYTLIWTKEGISPLGKFTLKIRPDAFIDMLIRLIENGKIKIPEVLCVLQEGFSDDKAYNTSLLKEFLETVIHDKKDLLGEDTECLMLLAKLYLKSLINKQPKTFGQGVMMKHPVVFGPRPSWLNEMPPFCGKSISRNCSFTDAKNEEFGEIECLCRACNEDLLRLQALLYQNRSLAELREQVLEFLFSGEKEVHGHSSLAVLCLDEERALKKLLEVASSALFPFAQDMFGTDEEKWCMLLSTMQKEMTDISEEDSKYETYSKTFHGVLQHLAETMTIPAFVSILPKGESIYEPYVKLCVKKHRSRQLKSKIVALGNEIKALM